jgi:ubiquinone/menaquinone biosynthesis C-methylase UbiE
MSLSKYLCLHCRSSDWATYPGFWECKTCGQKYTCTTGIPILYIESHLQSQDKELRDYFYNGLLGTYYQYVMPFLTLPVRPAKASWRGWIVYALLLLVLATLVGYVISLFVVPGRLRFSAAPVGAALLCLSICYFFYRHPYLFFLILLAIPVKISVLLNRFKPSRSFQEIHARAFENLSQKGTKLQILDISTGTCNSLYRHGWMQLDAEYTGLDLSETMLLQGRAFMSRKNVPMNFVLADAARLPFQDESFDVALNYGALNGYSNPQLALEEMARVTKSGGLVLFLDEQLYPSASVIEKLYFRTVLSSHNVIHRCPVELLPASLQEIAVNQVYQFYYLCTAHKR